MNTGFTEQADPGFQIDLKDDHVKKVTPEPLKKPFRQLEIGTGLVCLLASLWLLVQLSLWLAGALPVVSIHSPGEALFITVQSVYLLGFGVNLLRSGYVALVFWMIAIAILTTQLLTTVVFN